MNAEEMKSRFAGWHVRYDECVIEIDRLRAQIAMLRETLEMFPYSHRARVALAATEQGQRDAHAATEYAALKAKAYRQFANTNWLVKQEPEDRTIAASEPKS